MDGKRRRRSRTQLLRAEAFPPRPMLTSSSSEEETDNYDENPFLAGADGLVAADGRVDLGRHLPQSFMHYSVCRFGFDGPLVSAVHREASHNNNSHRNMDPPESNLALQAVTHLIQEIHECLRGTVDKRIVDLQQESIGNNPSNESEQERLRYLSSLVLSLSAKLDSSSLGVPEVVWRSGMFQLQHLLFSFLANENGNNSDTEDCEQVIIKILQLFQTLISRRAKTPANTLLTDHISLDLVLFLLRLDRVDDALQRLESSLTSSRAGASWLHRCYCGMLLFAQWDQRIRKSEDIEEGEECDFDYYASLDEDLVVNYEFKAALRQFEMAVELCDDDPVKMDFAFIPTIVKLYLVEKRFEDAFLLIKEFFSDQKETGCPYAARTLMNTFLKNVIRSRINDVDDWISSEELEELLQENYEWLFYLYPTYEHLQDLLACTNDSDSQIEYQVHFLSHMRSMELQLRRPGFDKYLRESLQIWEKLACILIENIEDLEMVPDDRQAHLGKLEHHFNLNLIETSERYFKNISQSSMDVIKSLRDDITKLFILKYVVYKLLIGDDMESKWLPFAHVRTRNPDTILLSLNYIKSVECAQMCRETFQVDTEDEVQEILVQMFQR